MSAFNGLLQKLLIIVLTIGLLSACGGKEERKAKYLEKGKSYLAEKNYDKAKIEFKNVLQIDPKDANGYLFLGQVEEKQKNWAKAFGSYKKATELDPELIEPRFRIAKFYLAQASALKARKDESGTANALGLVQEQIKEIRTREPENTEALTLEATLWINDDEKDKAILQLEQVIERNPGEQSAAALLSSLYDQQGRTDDAEAVLRHAVKASSEPVALQRRLAAHYANNKQNDKAETVLRQIVDQNPDELSHRVSLAAFLSRTEQTDKAEQVLNKTIAADPEDAQRYLLLTEFLASRKSKEAAIEKLQQFIQQQPDMTELQFSLVKLYLTNEQKDEARQALQALIDSRGTEPAGLRARLVLAQILASENINNELIPVLLKEVLDENPRDNDVLLLKGKLAANNKDYVDAINNFRSVLKDQPNNTEVLRLLAAAHLANEEKELALDTLRRGIESSPDNPGLRLSLAQLLTQDGDIDGALEQLDAILIVDKFNRPALRAKFELLARKGDAAGMDEVAKLMQEGAPDSEIGHIQEARLRFAEKDYVAAVDILDKVLAKNPESITALLAKMDVLAAQKKYDEAIVLMERLLEIRPGSADAYYYKGKLLQEQDKLNEAAKQYEVALQKASNSAEVLNALVGLEIRQGKKVEAVQRLLAILEENPQHASANELLGILYVSNKDYAKAEKAFERQIAINPGRASLYIQLSQSRKAQDNSKGAVGALQQGLDELPDDVGLLLALAGLQEYQKDYEAAISTYEKVLELKSGNAIAVNNLASLLSDHRTDEASLNKAAELAVTLERSDQAPFLDTAGWVFYRKGDYERAVKVLKKAVDSKPEVPVFQYHLGMTYFSLGDKVAASEHLTKATAGDASYVGVEEARATLKKL